MIFKTITDKATISGQRIVSVLQLKKIAQEKVNRSIQEHIAQLELDKAALIGLEQKIKSGMGYGQAYAQSMNNASNAAKEHAIQTKGVAGTTDTFVAKQKVVQAELEATAISTKIASVGINALRTTFNIFSGMAIMWGISKIIEGFEYLSQSAEKAKTKLTEIQTELCNNSSSYKSNRETLVGLQYEYDTLTKKAEKLGGVQNLANDEYKRYQEITSQILGITPKLTTGWNDEGIAISNKNNLLQCSINLLDEEYEKSLRNNTTKAKNEAVASGVIAKVEEFESSADTKTASGTQYKLVWKDLKQYVNEAVENGIVEYTYKSTGIVGHDSADAAYAINEFVYGDSLYEATEVNTAYGWLGSLQERILSSEESLKQFTESLNDTENPIYQWFTNEQIDELIRDSDAYFQECQRIIDDRETLFQDYRDQLNWNAQATNDKNGNNAYKQLSDESKAAITDYINNLDYASIKTTDDFVEMANNVRNFTKLLATNETIADYIREIYTPQNEDETVETYVKRVRNAIRDVQTYCNENRVTVPISFDDSEQAINNLEAQYQRAVDFAKNMFDGYDPTDFFKEHSINTQEEIDAWLKIAQESSEAIEAEKKYVQNSLPAADSTSLSSQLTTSQESLDNFQSSVKSASDAYSTLLSGSYSSSELLDSIQAINQAVSSMGGSLNWEFIDSQSNSLEVLGNAIEYVSEQYADSILSGAGIDPDSDFGKILAENIIQAQKAATLLEAVNEQIDSLQEAYQNLTDAVDTYNQCGHITFDQLQNLLSMEPQYLACLTNENGQLQLNRQAMQNLADRRLYDAKVQAVQQAISELGTLTHHDEQKAITDSAQAFRDSVDDVSAYNMELAKTLTEAGIAAPLIRDLGAALNGAEERGASDVDIQTVINNLNAKMKLIGSVDIGNLSGASSSAVSQAETDWKSLLDKETDLLEKQLAANLITFQAYINKRRQVIKNYYLDGKITAEEYYDALESMYGSQLSLYGKAVNAVTGRIDDEIDQLNEQKEAIENSYQVKIDAIQEEIDALNKANDARKAQIDLEKAQYEAERARNQRINKVYDGSQFVYAADVEAVRDAEENLADQKTQINISRLEAQIESLEREMENATKGLDSQIEALESYKEKWNDISGIYEEQQSKLIVAEILGADWESQVLNGRLDTLRSFTEQYIALQQAQADAAANAARIKAESAAGNATGGNVGTAPAAQDLWQTGDGNVDYKHFNRDVTQIYATMAHFHGGLDEGYATAPGQSTPANRSLALLQKLAGEKLLPNELPAILRHGELVITPEQQRNIIANTQRYCSLSSANSGYASSYSGEASQIHIDSLTISCPNVTNNSGAEYILKSLERLPLDNIQHSHRRRY